MSKIEWKRVKPLQHTIEEFEQEHSLSVPGALRKLIESHNGGRPSQNVTKTALGTEVEVKVLLSFNREDPETIYNVIGYFKQHFNGELLPFASEPSGDYFCVKLNDESIVYWEQETNEISKVADSLSEFLSGLYRL